MSSFLSGPLRLPYIVQSNSESRPDATGIPDNAMVFNSYNGRLFIRPSFFGRLTFGTSWIEPGVDLAVKDRATFTSPLAIGLKDVPAQRFQTSGTVRLTPCQIGRRFFITNASGGTLTVQQSDGTTHVTLRVLVAGETATFIRQAGFVSGTVPRWELQSTSAGSGGGGPLAMAVGAFA